MRSLPKSLYIVWSGIYVFFAILGLSTVPFFILGGISVVTKKPERLVETLLIVGSVTAVFVVGAMSARFLTRRELRKIDADVVAHATDASGVIALTMWRPKATVLQKWPEASLTVDNGVVTVTVEGRVLVQGPAAVATAKVGFRAIRLRCNGDSVELFPFPSIVTFNFRSREYLAARASELRVAFQGKTPAWIAMPTSGMSPQVPAVPVSTPPGWHPDPHGITRLRWWDGAQWTAHTSE